jgi:hypothetical protein
MVFTDAMLAKTALVRRVSDLFVSEAFFFTLVALCDVEAHFFLLMSSQAKKIARTIQTKAIRLGPRIKVGS